MYHKIMKNSWIINFLKIVGFHYQNEASVKFLKMSKKNAILLRLDLWLEKAERLIIIIGDSWHHEELKNNMNPYFLLGGTHGSHRFFDFWKFFSHFFGYYFPLNEELRYIKWGEPLGKNKFQELSDIFVDRSFEFHQAEQA